MPKVCVAGLVGSGLGLLSLTNASTSLAATSGFDAASLQAAKFSIRVLNHTESGSQPDYGGGINSAGEAVGQGTRFVGGGGVWWSADSAMHVLPAYPTTNARYAEAINDSGLIAGQLVYGNSPAVLWRPDGTFAALPAPNPKGASFSSNGEGHAYGINNGGKIVGVANYSGPLFSNWPHATVWEPQAGGGYAGQRLNTGLTPAGSPYAGGANDVSDTGLIAGNVSAGPGLTHGTAVMWDASYALNYLPDPNVGKTILGTAGVAIAEDGAVAGTVTYYASGNGGNTGARPVVWEPAAGGGGGYTARLLQPPAGRTLETIYTRDVTPGGEIVVATGWTGLSNTGATSGLLWTDDGTAMTLTSLLQDSSWEVTDAFSVDTNGDTLLISALIRPAGSSQDPVPAVLTAIVPEPTGGVLLGAAAVSAGSLGRRRRRQQTR